MKKLLLFITALLSFSAGAQPSSSTSIALRIIDEEGQYLSKEEFVKNFEIAGVNGRKIDSLYINDFIYSEESHKYLRFWLTVIYPPYALKLYYQGDSMVLHLPLELNEYYELLALDVKFQSGEYLLHFELDNLPKIKMFGNREFYCITEPDWDVLRLAEGESIYK